MLKRDYVKESVAHRETDRVPYCVRLTGEAYKAYGERLMKDFPCGDASDDLKEGRLGFNQAVDMSIGNYMADIPTPWWDWDYDNMPKAYGDPYEVPDVMPPIKRRDGDADFERFYENSKYIAGRYGTYNTSLIWGSHWEKAYFTRGIENFLADLAGAPEFAGELLRYIVDTNLTVLPRIVENEHIDGILLGSDWGTQNDLIMSPKTWRELIKDGEARQYRVIRGAGKDVMVHSCGCILRVMDDIVELGVRILNPVQPECMDLGFLKEKYGGDITFWGGISTQRTLPYGTPDEVRRETERVIKLMSAGGGYITCPSQEIQTDVPYENLKALIETARSFA